MSSRREMLKWLGAAGIGGLALPAVPALISRGAGSIASADGPPPPKRLVVVFTHNNMLSGTWMPTGGETDFALSPVLAPFSPFRDKLLVLHNLRSAFHDHIDGYRSTLNEADGLGPSVDQLVAQRLGNATRIRSLELGVQCGAGSMSYSGARLRLPPMEHPRAAFDRIVNAAQDDPATRDRLAAQGSLVLQAVADRYSVLSSRLSESERRLVDAHQREVGDLRLRVADPAMVRACALPPPPAVPTGSAPLRDESLFPDVLRAQLDNIVTALTCDVTRVATLMIGGSGSNTRYTFMPDPVMDIAHDVAHGFVNATTAIIDDAEGQWSRIQTWHAEQIAYLLGRLDAVPEGDGTLLDSTVVAWVSELGLGETGTHQRSNMPVVLAGGAGGYFRTGRFLDCDGRPYADLLLTLAHAMGYEDVTTFGVDGTAPLDMLRA